MAGSSVSVADAAGLWLATMVLLVPSEIVLVVPVRGAVERGNALIVTLFPVAPKFVNTGVAIRNV
jgi:hypothetical protein